MGQKGVSSCVQSSGSRFLVKVNPEKEGGLPPLVPFPPRSHCPSSTLCSQDCLLPPAKRIAKGKTEHARPPLQRLAFAELQVGGLMWLTG